MINDQRCRFYLSRPDLICTLALAEITGCSGEVGLEMLISQWTNYSGVKCVVLAKRRQINKWWKLHCDYLKKVACPRVVCRGVYWVQCLHPHRVCTGKPRLSNQDHSVSSHAILYLPIMQSPCTCNKDFFSGQLLPHRGMWDNNHLHSANTYHTGACGTMTISTRPILPATQGHVIAVVLVFNYWLCWL